MCMVPIARCRHVESFASRATILCQGFLLHGASVCQVAHVKEPLCAYIPHRMVPSFSYITHPCVPPLAKGGYPCAKLPAFLFQGGHVKVPLYAELPIARCHCVPSCPSQGAITYQVANRKPLRAKLPIARCHRVPCCPSQGAIVWHIAHRKVLSCAKFIMSRCHRVATFPIAWCHRRLSHGSPMDQVSHLIEPSCAYVPHVKEQSCAYFPHVKVPSFSFVAHPMCPLLCPKFSIAWGAPRVPREAIT